MEPKSITIEAGSKAHKGLRISSADKRALENAIAGNTIKNYKEKKKRSLFYLRPFLKP